MLRLKQLAGKSTLSATTRLFLGRMSVDWRKLAEYVLDDSQLLPNCLECFQAFIQVAG